MKLQKPNNEQGPSRRVAPRALAVASALAIAASGATAPKANADKNPKNATPLQALTGVVARLKKGKSARVTADYVGVTGPISNAAEARPLEFTAGGKTYFAYTQEHKPDFKASAAQIAGTMAIIEVQIPSDNGVLPLTEAHLNRRDVLVGTNDHTPVGYSIGGDSPASGSDWPQGF